MFVCVFVCLCFVHNFGLWRRELLSGCGCYRVYTVGIAEFRGVCIGNRMDESVIWEKISWQQENYTRRNQVLFELL